MYDKFMENAILLAKKQEYVSRKYKKSDFSTKYRISAQNRIRPCNLLGYFSKMDLSGTYRLFYILSKNKIFCNFGRHILDFLPIISRFPWIYRTFSVKNLFFVKIKNKRTKQDTSLHPRANKFYSCDKSDVTRQPSHYVTSINQSPSSVK